MNKVSKSQFYWYIYDEIIQKGACVTSEHDKSPVFHQSVSDASDFQSETNTDM